MKTARNGKMHSDNIKGSFKYLEIFLLPRTDSSKTALNDTVPIQTNNFFVKFPILVQLLSILSYRVTKALEKIHIQTSSSASL